MAKQSVIAAGKCMWSFYNYIKAAWQLPVSYDGRERLGRTGRGKKGYHCGCHPVGLDCNRFLAEVTQPFNDCAELGYLDAEERSSEGMRQECVVVGGT